MAKDMNMNIQVFRGTETKMSVKEHDGGKCHFLYQKLPCFPCFTYILCCEKAPTS